MKKGIRNYDLLGGYSYYLPGGKGILILTILLLVGALIGNVLSALLMLCIGGFGSSHMTLIAYPVMFIPPMMYALSASRNNSMFEEQYTVDNNNFGKSGWFLCAVLAVVSTVAMAFVMDSVNSVMPQMPQWLEETLKQMTDGDNFWLNFICVSLFAPFFEEWLCRGMVLRGLLHKTRKDGSRMKPMWAILLSSAYFGLIHLNPWQAIPAIALGCLFGYVYYKTGSLKLTMLMHMANNTLALILSNVDRLAEADYLVSYLGHGIYWPIAALCIVIIWLSVKVFSRIPSRP